MDIIGTGGQPCLWNLKIYSPGCPSPTDSDVKRKFDPSSISYGMCPFPKPFVYDVSGILNLVTVLVPNRELLLHLTTVEKRHRQRIPVVL